MLAPTRATRCAFAHGQVFASEENFHLARKKSTNVVLVLPRSLQVLLDVLLVESSSVSRQSIATSAFRLFAVVPCFRCNSSIELRVVQVNPSIHPSIGYPVRCFCILPGIVVSRSSIESPSHPSSHPWVIHRRTLLLQSLSIVVSPSLRLSGTSPQRGIASPIHAPSWSSSLVTFASSSSNSSSHSSSHPSVNRRLSLTVKSSKR
jgi:hypothetical protein